VKTFIFMCMFLGSGIPRHGQREMAGYQCRQLASKTFLTKASRSSDYWRSAVLQLCSSIDLYGVNVKTAVKWPMLW